MSDTPWTLLAAAERLDTETVEKHLSRSPTGEETELLEQRR